MSYMAPPCCGTVGLHATISGSALRYIQFQSNPEWFYPNFLPVSFKFLQEISIQILIIQCPKRFFCCFSTDWILVQYFGPYQLRVPVCPACTQKILPCSRHWQVSACYLYPILRELVWRGVQLTSSGFDLWESTWRTDRSFQTVLDYMAKLRVVVCQQRLVIDDFIIIQFSLFSFFIFSLFQHLYYRNTRTDRNLSIKNGPCTPATGAHFLHEGVLLSWSQLFR
jgi:hypothetical protein